MAQDMMQDASTARRYDRDQDEWSVIEPDTEMNIPRKRLMPETENEAPQYPKLKYDNKGLLCYCGLEVSLIRTKKQGPNCHRLPRFKQPQLQCAYFRCLKDENQDMWVPGTPSLLCSPSPTQESESPSLPKTLPSQCPHQRTTMAGSNGWMRRDLGADPDREGGEGPPGLAQPPHSGRCLFGERECYSTRGGIDNDGGILRGEFSEPTSTKAQAEGHPSVGISAGTQPGGRVRGVSTIPGHEGATPREAHGVKLPAATSRNITSSLRPSEQVWTDLIPCLVDDDKNQGVFQLKERLVRDHKRGMHKKLKQKYCELFQVCPDELEKMMKPKPVKPKMFTNLNLCLQVDLNSASQCPDFRQSLKSCLEHHRPGLVKILWAARSSGSQPKMTLGDNPHVNLSKIANHVREHRRHKQDKKTIEMIFQWCCKVCSSVALILPESDSTWLDWLQERAEVYAADRALLLPGS